MSIRPQPPMLKALIAILLITLSTSCKQEDHQTTQVIATKRNGDSLVEESNKISDVIEKLNHPRPAKPAAFECGTPVLLAEMLSQSKLAADSLRGHPICINCPESTKKHRSRTR